MALNRITSEAQNFGLPQHLESGVFNVLEYAIGSSVNWSVDPSNPIYGGYWDGVNNDSPALQAAADYAATFNPRKALTLPPFICLKDSVFIPWGVAVIGYGYRPGFVGTYFATHAAASYSTGFALNFNTLDGTTPFYNVYFRPYMNVVLGIYVSNFTAQRDNMRFMVAFGGTLVNDIYSSRMKQIIKKPNNYTDNWTIERIHVYVDKNDAWYNIEDQIDIGAGGAGGSGDALHISQLNMPQISPPIKAVKIQYSYGLKLDCVVNGVYTITDCRGAELSNIHLEDGQLIFTRTDLSVRDSYVAIHSTESYYPIELYTTSGRSYTLALDNVRFIYGNITYMGTNTAEIKHCTDYEVHCNNAKRAIVMVGSEDCNVGIRMVTAAGVLIAEWNDNSHYLSQRGSFINNRAVGTFNQVIVGDFGGVYSPAVFSGYPSTLANTTYYYTAMILLDAVTGMYQNYGEASAATGGTGKSLGLNVEYGTCTPMCKMRIYRGIASNSYGFYADVNVINGRILVDNGGFIAGVAWIARGAGPIDALTYPAGGEYTVTPSQGARIAAPVSQIFGDVSASNVGRGSSLKTTVLLNSPLTAARTFTINTALTKIGSCVRVERTLAATGAFIATVNNPSAGFLFALDGPGTWVEVELNSDSVWRVTAAGDLLPSRGEAIVGDANATIGVLGCRDSTVIADTPLTVARTLTVLSTLTRIGSRVHVARTANATGAFALNINNPAAGLLKAIATAGNWAVVELGSDSVWREIASGPL